MPWILNIGRASLKGSATYDGGATGRLTLAAPDLDDFSALALQKLGGALNADIAFDNTSGGQNATIDAKGVGLRTRDASIERFSAVAFGPRSSAPPGARRDGRARQFARWQGVGFFSQSEGASRRGGTRRSTSRSTRVVLLSRAPPRSPPESARGSISRRSPSNALASASLWRDRRRSLSAAARSISRASPSMWAVVGSMWTAASATASTSPRGRAPFRSRSRPIAYPPLRRVAGARSTPRNTHHRDQDRAQRRLEGYARQGHRAAIARQWAAVRRRFPAWAAGGRSHPASTPISRWSSASRVTIAGQTPINAAGRTRCRRQGWARRRLGEHRAFRQWPDLEGQDEY